MTQIGDDCHLFALRNLCTNLIINKGKDSFSGRTYLRILKRTLHLRQTLTEDIEIKFLHLQLCGGHFLFIFKLLLKLFVFELGNIIA